MVWLPLSLPTLTSLPLLLCPAPPGSATNAPAFIHQPGLLLGRIPGPDAAGSLSPQQELEPGLSIQSHTSSCLDKATGCQGPGVNEFTALHTLAPPGSRRSSVGLTWGPEDPAQTGQGPGLVQEPQGKLCTAAGHERA